MNRIITLFLIITLTLCTKAFSQATFPYHMGFDTAFNQQGWQQYRKGIFTSYAWGPSSYHPYAGDAFQYHDYPVGTTATDTTVDWYVSPALDFVWGGKIDSVKLNIYTIGSLTAVDQLAFYLLSGSQDPATATSIRLLADVSYMASSTMGWRDTSGIVIPAIGGMGYIGIKYRATNNWFTAGVDELYVTGNHSTPAGLPPVCTGDQSILVYPNPSRGLITIQNTTRQNVEMLIYDPLGREVKREPIDGGRTLSIDIADGLYSYKMMDGERNVKSVGRLVVAR